jgi:16S rRNA (cytosine967-C5)-methyltransferase
MPITHALFNALVEALALVLPLNSPADISLKLFFRDRPKLGHRDRGFIAETIYAVLRHRRVIGHFSPKATPRMMALIAMTRFQRVNLGDLNLVLKRDEETTLAEMRNRALPVLPLAVEAELPDWVVSRLTTFMAPKDILALGNSMMTAAPLDLRVNSFKAKRDAVLKRFQQEGIACAPTPHSPLGIRLDSKISLAKHAAFLEGFVEVQDEGSQILGLLLDAKRGEMVVDFCAGAGGKSLLIGASMASTGRLYAFDVSEKRLENLGPRLKRSGLSNVMTQRIASENDTKIKRLAGKIDRVLVDAPCTGLGTLRRNPDLKYRQSETSLKELNVKQASILSSASRLVANGGTLVYATCSLLPEENEMIVEAFMKAHPDFSLVNASDILAKQKIVLKGSEPYLRLSPQKHGTDGFFAAVLVKTGAQKSAAKEVAKEGAKVKVAAVEEAPAKVTTKKAVTPTAKAVAKTTTAKTLATSRKSNTAKVTTVTTKTVAKKPSQSRAQTKSTTTKTAPKTKRK